MGSKTTQQKLGAHAENLACEYLEAQGLRCITRNFNCKLGEIDLIMRDKETVAFVEVRCRGATSRGTPLESISYRKRTKLTRAAHVFLKKHWQNTPPACRFDVVSVTSTPARHCEEACDRSNPETIISKNHYKITWVKDAFQVQ